MWGTNIGSQALAAKIYLTNGNYGITGCHW
jgi:hypothetical protein